MPYDYYWRFNTGPVDLSQYTGVQNTTRITVADPTYNPTYVMTANVPYYTHFELQEENSRLQKEYQELLEKYNKLKESISFKKSLEPDLGLDLE
jgi:hypothetical protein